MLAEMASQLMSARRDEPDRTRPVDRESGAGQQRGGGYYYQHRGMPSTAWFMGIDEWAETHHSELEQAWEDSRVGRTPASIAPLEWFGVETTPETEVCWSSPRWADCLGWAL